MFCGCFCTGLGEVYLAKDCAKDCVLWKISMVERSSGLLALALCFVVTLPPFSSGFSRFSSGNQ